MPTAYSSWVSESKVKDQPRCNPPKNTTPKPYPPKLLIREHGIGIFDVFKGLSRGYSYICRLRTAAGYLDLQYIPSPAPLVGFYDSWAVREHQNQKYAYDPTDSIDWLLSTAVGPILPGKGIQTRATLCPKSRTSPMRKSNPSQNTMPKPHLPKLLIREHSIGIFDVFKGLNRGYSYICRLRAAAGYLDLQHIQTRATFCPKSRTSLDATHSRTPCPNPYPPRKKICCYSVIRYAFARTCLPIAPCPRSLPGLKLALLCALSSR